MERYWEGTLIRLRPVQVEDAPAHHAFNHTSDYAMLDRQYPPGSLEHVEAWARQKAAATPADDALDLQMEALATGELVGHIATNRCDARVGLVSYGINVLDGHRGKGYAREAVCLVLRYYFQELRFQKANVDVYAVNPASRALHESLGFVLEGRLRRSVYTRGEFSDLLHYGLTVEEFRELHPDYWREELPS